MCTHKNRNIKYKSVAFYLSRKLEVDVKNQKYFFIVELTLR